MKRFQDRAGFTLIEVLIVVILLGILSSLFLPQFSASTEDTNLNTLKTNLTYLRKAIDLYHYQHNNTYPGRKKWDGQNDAASPIQAATSFIMQLTQYTDVTGDVDIKMDADHKFGPYLKSDDMPLNPFNNNKNTICDITATDITEKSSDGSSGWKFYTKTGVLMANDWGHDNL